MEFNIGMDKATGIGFEALFNNASMGIVIVDGRGTIVLANPFLLKQFLYTADELLGAPIERLIPGRFHQKHTQHTHHYHENPNSRPMGLGMDLFAVRKDGIEFPVEVSLGSYETDRGRFTIAFLSDISKRKEAETALYKLNEELESQVAKRTQKLSKVETDLRHALEKEKELSELKSRFVSMASHEFRTPLSTVLSSAYLLSKYTSAEDQPKREKHVQRIISSVNMLTDVLNDFLSVGKIEEGKITVRYTTFDISDYIHQIIGELNGLLKNGQSIFYEHEGDTSVRMDAGLLKHIVMNLLSNAVKFSPEGAAISVSSEKTMHGLTLLFKDKGMGISAEDQQHLFERFFRGSNVSHIQGTGLGLHIVSKYAELMNGTISCTSAEGEGTAFELLFSQTKIDASYEKDPAY